MKRFALMGIFGVACASLLTAEATRPATQPATAAAPGTQPTREPVDEAAARTRWSDAPAGARFTAEGWFAPRDAEPDPELPATLDGEEVYVIPIRGGILQALGDAIERKAIRATTGGAELVIFDIDTPGGRVDVTQRINEIITDHLAGVYTVAFVNPEAISAGAIISLACDEIVMTPNGRLGDAMPVMMSPGGGYQPMPAEERAKIESYMLTYMRNLAERGGYSPDLAEAMVSMSIEIWLIRNTETGQLKYLNLEKHPRYEPRAGAEPADPKQRPMLETPWTYVRLVDPSHKILTLTTDEAVELGFAAGTSEDIDALARRFNVLGEPVYLKDSTLEKVVAFLTSPVVSSILMFVGIMAIYAELNSPGIGIPAAIAVLAFTVLFGSRYLVGLAAYWEVIAFLLGILLLLVELFAIPGFGVAGVSGVLLMLAALVSIFVANAPDEWPIPQTDLDWSLFRNGMVALLLAMIGSFFGALLLAKYLPKVPLAGRLVLRPVTTAPDGGGATTEDAPVRSIQPGQTGVTLGPLRPVGEVRVGEELVDAVSEGDFIPAGTEVTVVRNQGYRLVVTPTRET